jgi:hypothetical protein
MVYIMYIVEILHYIYIMVVYKMVKYIMVKHIMVYNGNI